MGHGNTWKKAKNYIFRRAITRAWLFRRSDYYWIWSNIWKTTRKAVSWKIGGNWDKCKKINESSMNVFCFSPKLKNGHLRFIQQFLSRSIYTSLNRFGEKPRWTILNFFFSISSDFLQYRFFESFKKLFWKVIFSNSRCAWMAQLFNKKNNQFLTL